MWNLTLSNVWLCVGAGELAAVSPALIVYSFVPFYQRVRLHIARIRLGKLPVCVYQDVLFEQTNDRATRGIHGTHNLTLSSMRLSCR